MHQDPQEVASASHCLCISLHPYLHDPDVLLCSLAAVMLMLMLKQHYTPLIMHSWQHSQGAPLLSITSSSMLMLVSVLLFKF